MSEKRTGDDDGRPGPWTGRDLGRWKVGTLLGAGGMGEVYRAHDANLDQAVVLKVPHARYLADPRVGDEFRQRFAREVKSLTQARHPHVVTVLDYGEHEDIPYAVLEYLAGGSLRDRIDAAQGGKESPEEVLEWLDPAAKTLDYIHAQGVVHRDIKPGNVLFDHAGHVKLADFGIAKALRAMDTGITATDVTPGSPEFMAPEAGRTTDLKPAYDQYSLAAMVYNALTGHLPIDGDSRMVIMAKKMTEDPAPLREVAPHIPPAAAAAVMRALSRAPEQRFAGCQEFAHAFRAGLTQALTTAGLPADTTRRVRRPVPAGEGASPGAKRPRSKSGGRRRILRLPLFLVLAALGGAGWWFGLGPGRGSPTAPDVPPEGVGEAPPPKDAALPLCGSSCPSQSPQRTPLFRLVACPRWWTRWAHPRARA
ncbi:MAG: protein kinase [Planctomycetes bacterium]|nr:protein kinase [Planctomycetota bacterium]